MTTQTAADEFLAMASRSARRRSLTRVTSDQVWEALRVIDAATKSMCESLIEKCGTSRAAAEALGVSAVHFCNMRGGHAQASLDLLEKWCCEDMQ
jgi:hypothetical protein